MQVLRAPVYRWQTDLRRATENQYIEWKQTLTQLAQKYDVGNSQHVLQAVYELTDRSFLDEKAKCMYKRSYQERLSRFSRI